MVNLEFGIVMVLWVNIRVVIPQQCYEYTCTGNGCLTTEVTTNPLLIKKCDRLIYKGCYTITTSFTGFSTTTTGCIDRSFECQPGKCSSLTSVTDVTCCNTDLCNDGESTSAGARPSLALASVMCLSFVILRTIM